MDARSQGGPTLSRVIEVQIPALEIVRDGSPDLVRQVSLSLVDLVGREDLRARIDLDVVRGEPARDESTVLRA